MSKHRIIYNWKTPDGYTVSFRFAEFEFATVERVYVLFDPSIAFRALGLIGVNFAILAAFTQDNCPHGDHCRECCGTPCNDESNRWSGR